MDIADQDCAEAQQTGCIRHLLTQTQYSNCLAAQKTAGGGNTGGRPVTVPQDVDAYATPGGTGNPNGTVPGGSAVTLLQSRPDQWCHVSGNTVPNGDAWVWCGAGFELR